MEIEKNLNSITKKVEDMSTNLNQHSEDMQNFKQQIGELHSDISKVHITQKEVMSTFSSQIEMLKKLNQDMKTETYDFKLVKANIKSKLVPDVLESFRDELRTQIKKLDTDNKSYNDVKDNLKRIVEQLGVVEGEIGKFKKISQCVQETDFNLNKYAKELENTDKEKLALMHKVDKLQMLIAKERRQR